MSMITMATTTTIIIIRSQAITHGIDGRRAEADGRKPNHAPIC